MGLSGGIASTTLLARFLDLGFDVSTIGFNYTAAYNGAENHAAFKIAKHYNVSFNMIDITSLMSNIQLEIPESKETQTTNMLFISILAEIAKSVSFDAVSLGTQNCSRAFASAMDLSTLFSSNKKMGLELPYLGKEKSHILHEGLYLKVPYNLTHTCLTNLKYACGICENCIERIGLFKIAGIPDPLTYVRLT